MNAARVLIGIGLGFDGLGTLFISLDVLRGQKENSKTLDLIAWILRFKKGDEGEYTDNLVERALATDPHSDPKIAELQQGLQNLNDMWEILTAGEKGADQADRQNLQKRLNCLNRAFKNRAPLIYAAISLVALGGLLELIGGVFLG